MQFTPQQLAGGQKYSATTRIGNWQEEIALEESKLSNFQNKASTGNLSIRKQQNKIAKCTETVPHTFSEDGYIRFGDSVIMKHNMTGAILACDVFETVEPGIEQYIVSGSLVDVEPMARNVFRILRPPAHLRGLEDDENDPILRMGQAFGLGCNESLLVTPGSSVLSPSLYLCSVKKNERTSTKRSNKQSVFLSPKNDADSVWLSVFPSKGHMQSSRRYLSIGQPSTIQDALQITHRQTNMFLSCDPASKEMSEFGLELECFADRTAGNGKLSLITSEFKGLSTAQTLEKPDSPNYAWHFVMSSDQSTSEDRRYLPPSATPEVLISQIQEYMRSRGVDGFWDLRAYFQQLSDQLRTRLGKFDREDFKEAFLDFGCPFDGKYLDSIIDLIDPKHLGLVGFTEFISLIRGEMQERRVYVIDTIFANLDLNNEGRLSHDFLVDRFNGENHPLVTQRGLTTSEALQHFIQSFKVNNKLPMSATYEAFYNYFADLSAGTDDDEYFDSVVTSLF